MNDPAKKEMNKETSEKQGKMAKEIKDYLSDLIN